MTFSQLGIENLSLAAIFALIAVAFLAASIGGWYVGNWLLELRK